MMVQTRSASRPGLHHDLVVIGASAGGVEALKTLMSHLPGDLPAAILITLHLSPHGRSALADILNRVSPIKTSNAQHGDSVHCGRAYLCVPDHHLLVRGNQIVLGHGPRENGSRPAIDVLFRSAAADYGPRVIGVLLTGNLDDGTAGFVAIKERLGITVAQDPTEALFPSMPQTAIESTTVNHVVPLEEMPGLLQRLVAEPIPTEAVPPVPPEMLTEIDMAGRALGKPAGQRLGSPSVFGCPDCGGPLNEVNEVGLLRFRCHVGHAWSSESLSSVQVTKVEDALWTAIRWLEEEHALSHHGAQRARRRGNERVAKYFEDRAIRALERSQTLREFVKQEDPIPGTDDSPVEPGNGQSATPEHLAETVPRV